MYRTLQLEFGKKNIEYISCDRLFSFLKQMVPNLRSNRLVSCMAVSSLDSSRLPAKEKIVPQVVSVGNIV